MGHFKSIALIKKGAKQTSSLNTRTRHISFQLRAPSCLAEKVINLINQSSVICKFNQPNLHKYYVNQINLHIFQGVSSITSPPCSFKCEVTFGCKPPYNLLMGLAC
jgi:hypothetical protein